MALYDKNSSSFQMTGICGTYCAACECARAKEEPQIMAYLLGKGFPESKLPCPGCRELQGHCPVIGEQCATYRCALDKGVEFCFECAEFPCVRLNPAADRAGVLPHNLKVFNSCLIQQQGLDALVSRVADIRQRYYQGKMVIGRGPQID